MTQNGREPGSLTLIGIAYETAYVVLNNAWPLAQLVLLIAAWNVLVWLMPDAVKACVVLASPFIGPLPFLVWLDILSTSLTRGRTVSLGEVFHGGPLRVFLAFVLTAGLGGAVILGAIIGFPFLMMWAMTSDIGMRLWMSTRGTAVSSPFAGPSAQLIAIAVAVGLGTCLSMFWFGVVGILAGRDRLLTNLRATIRAPFVAPMRFAAWHFAIASLVVLATRQLDLAFPPPATVQQIMAEADGVPMRVLVKMAAAFLLVLWTSAASVVFHHDLTRR